MAWRVGKCTASGSVAQSAPRCSPMRLQLAVRLLRGYSTICNLTFSSPVRFERSPMRLLRESVRLRRQAHFFREPVHVRQRLAHAVRCSLRLHARESRHHFCLAHVLRTQRGRRRGGLPCVAAMDAFQTAGSARLRGRCRRASQSKLSFTPGGVPRNLYGVGFPRPVIQP